MNNISQLAIHTTQKRGLALILTQDRARQQKTNLIANLILEGPLFVVSGDEWLPSFSLPRVIRGRTTEVKAVLDRLRTTRASTCYRLLDSLANTVSKGEPILVMEFLHTFHDPYLNQFTQPDTIVPNLYNPQDWNRYAYARNNPLKYTDPNGHDPILFVLLLGVIILSACAPTPTPTQVSASDGLTPRQAEIQALIDEGQGSYQTAIDKAIELYDIDTHGVDPTFNATLDSYGNTEPDGSGTYENGILTGGSVVTTIGPEAFASPQDLVDTIAHEAVHVEQFKNGRWYEEVDKNGDGDCADCDGANLNDVEAYDRVLELKDELELSEAVINYDTGVRNDYYYDYLPDWLKERVDHGNYTLP